MPIPANEVVLGYLLGSCTSHGKLQLAERVLQKADSDGMLFRKLYDSKIAICRICTESSSAQVFPGSDDGVNLEKEQTLFSHSEKLAACFGLLSSKLGKPLYIFKNLRICHAVIKIVSKIHDRKIVL
ncbi:hypothetical protein GQ457_05G010020 [Hibiscus cannabinus]